MNEKYKNFKSLSKHFSPRKSDETIKNFNTEQPQTELILNLKQENKKYLDDLLNSKDLIEKLSFQKNKLSVNFNLIESKQIKKDIEINELKTKLKDFKIELDQIEAKSKESKQRYKANYLKSQIQIETLQRKLLNT